MRRFCSIIIIILLTAGILVTGMAITADSLEELGGKPITVLAVNNESSHTRITLLGTDYDLRLSDVTIKPLPSAPDLQDSLERALLWCQDLAFTRALNMPGL